MTLKIHPLKNNALQFFCPVITQNFPRWQQRREEQKKQECIPVGCLLPAHNRTVDLPDRDPPGPRPRGQTDICENIAFTNSVCGRLLRKKKLPSLRSFFELPTIRSNSNRPSLDTCRAGRRNRTNKPRCLDTLSMNSPGGPPGR